MPTKFGLWALGLVVCYYQVAYAEIDYNSQGLDCWDLCVFEAADNAEEEAELDNIYTIITKIRNMRIFTGVSIPTILDISYSISN
jgi:hypothetical protein